MSSRSAKDARDTRASGASWCFAMALAAPFALWHRAMAEMADDFHLDAGYLITGWMRLRPDRARSAAARARGPVRGRSARQPPLPALAQRVPRLGHLALPARHRAGEHRRLGRRHLDWRPMGRFQDPQDPLFQALNSSIAFDYRLAPYDLEQSLAHARMLARSGIISDEDLAALERGLDEVRREIDEDRFEVAPGDEDVHMAIERRLTEIAGPVGGKLHTARSRNDQVATDVAMLVRAHSLDRQGAAARADGHARRAGRAPPRLAAPRLHPPPARPAGVPLAPPARLLLEVPPRPPALQLLPHRHRRPAARRRRAGRA